MTEQEKNDLLIRVDSRVKYLVERVEKSEATLADHEDRHRECEKHRHQAVGGWKALIAAGTAGGAIVGAVGSAVKWLGTNPK